MALWAPYCEVDMLVTKIVGKWIYTIPFPTSRHSVTVTSVKPHTDTTIASIYCTILLKGRLGKFIGAALPALEKNPVPSSSFHFIISL